MRRRYSRNMQSAVGESQQDGINDTTDAKDIDVCRDVFREILTLSRLFGAKTAVVLYWTQVELSAGTSLIGTDMIANIFMSCGWPMRL